MPRRLETQAGSVSSPGRGGESPACSTIVLLLGLVLLASHASAETSRRFDLAVSGSTPHDSSVVAVDGTPMDYGVFLYELVAYAAKEVFRDSSDEYAHFSRIPSHLSTEMPKQRSNFGAHCLTVLGQIRSEVIPATGAGAALLFGYGSLAHAAIFAAGQVWSPVRNGIEDSRSGFSLNPKISSRKVGLNLTYHW